MHFDFRYQSKRRRSAFGTSSPLCFYNFNEKDIQLLYNKRYDKLRAKDGGRCSDRNDNEAAVEERKHYRDNGSEGGGDKIIG